MKPRRDLTQPSTKGDLDDMAAHIITAIGKTLEEYATKEDVQKLASKEDLKQLDTKVDTLSNKVDKLSYDVSDIRRRVIDLEVETKIPPHNPPVASSLSI